MDHQADESQALASSLVPDSSKYIILCIILCVCVFERVLLFPNGISLSHRSWFAPGSGMRALKVRWLTLI